PGPSRWSLPLPRGRSLELEAGRPRLMGVLNLTPDSFSDGGLWFDPSDPARSVERGLALLEEGADLLDLGAESTRPGGGTYGSGARTVPPEEELERLVPVLEGLRRATDAPLSVDTRKAAVARTALEAGADLVNDVSALGDPGMGFLVAEHGCPVILMHSRGDLRTMQRDIRFRDVVAEVRSELGEAANRALAAGVARDRIVVDPGLGFGKTAEHNLALLGALPELRSLGLPVLVGASRKSFLGAVTGEPPERRLPGSLAAAAWACSGGAAILRAHDAAETAGFLAVWQAIRREAGWGGDPAAAGPERAGGERRS
ncbi:MAG: dihydropteroate synthase, partial [Thermoanaerobaculia bacterium]